jgi:hypothetical protein
MNHQFNQTLNEPSQKTSQSQPHIILENAWLFCVQFPIGYWNWLFSWGIYAYEVGEKEEKKFFTFHLIRSK